MTGSDVLNEVIKFPGVSSRSSRAQRESARTRFPPRPVVTDWPATRHDRGAVWEVGSRHAKRTLDTLKTREFSVAEQR
jgi:hypothetical protein